MMMMMMMRRTRTRQTTAAVRAVSSWWGRAPHARGDRESGSDASGFSASTSGADSGTLNSGTLKALLSWESGTSSKEAFGSQFSMWPGVRAYTENWRVKSTPLSFVANEGFGPRGSK